MNREQIRDQLSRYGLTAVADELIARSRDAIALRLTITTNESLSIGKSRVGGMPDVPSVFTWPTRKGKPLNFLTLINCSEAASYDPTGLLPDHGMLLFFYDANEQPWGYHVDDFDGWKVRYIDDTDLHHLVTAHLPRPLEPGAVMCGRRAEVPAQRVGANGSPAACPVRGSAQMGQADLATFLPDG